MPILKTPALLMGFCALVIALGACTEEEASRARDAGLDAGLPGLCSQIPLADQTALYTSSSITSFGDSTECSFGVADGSHTYVSYADHDPSGLLINHFVTREHDPSLHDLEGIGDRALFRDNGGFKAPDLAAQEGSASCVVLTGFMPEPAYDIRYTIDAGAPVFALSDEAAFAQKLGRICNDLFATRRAMSQDE